MLVDCGGKGRMSDSGLFLSSQLKRFLERAAKSFPPPEPLGRHGIVNYHILCDGGFAQILHMQRPYTQTEWESQMRGYGLMGALIQHVWYHHVPITSLPPIITWLPRHCKLIITSVVILHNFMLRENSVEDIVRRFPSLAESSAPVRSQSRQAFNEARRQRKRLVNYFAEEDRI
ncbi:unnamed protein product [Heligmosomoides polygyrus]|uniref:DDE Tnp4 domain-containing protein n=1 Tax=Heligmosomoides polygyrus TaxID=6339 RepID=A0A183FMV4_HELPZ|nr:unnamed protein product [Heligmosomoides polygyrus]